ncbi:methyltransferase domain-containing protein [Candidatus Bipolaricaulota bacterium]|nr:methyltransferase domain-containing protein [Candidatus Bipolaricaulota bacterium]
MHSLKYSLDELVAYLREYPAFVSEIMTLHQCYDLPRVQRFFRKLDLTQPYIGPPQHKSYLQYKTEIAQIIQSPDVYSIRPHVLDQDYMNDGHLARVYTKAVSLYDAVNERYFPTPRKEAINWLNPQPGDKVLEIGIGPGSMFQYYPDYCKVIGIDISEGMINAAKERIREFGAKNITVSLMDAHKTTFPDEHFDKVLLFTSLCTVRNPFQVMKEINRISKREAIIVLFEPVKSKFEEVTVVQYLFQPIGSRMGHMWIEGFPAYCIPYNSYLDMFAILEELNMDITKHKAYDPDYDLVHLVRCKRGLRE